MREPLSLTEGLLLILLLPNVIVVADPGIAATPEFPLFIKLKCRFYGCKFGVCNGDVTLKLPLFTRFALLMLLFPADILSVLIVSN